jgi:hypothetical protein
MLLYTWVRDVRGGALVFLGSFLKLRLMFDPGGGIRVILGKSNLKLYLLRRKKRGYALHQAKEGFLVATLPCWSIFFLSRVFLGFPS